MSRFGRYLILALLGFGLGAGLAWFQQKGQTPMPAATEQAATAATEAATAPTPAPNDTMAMPGSSIGGAFTLTDQNGNTVTETSFPGKMTLVFFGYTNCPDICPATLDKMTAALNLLGADAGDKVQPLFITTDPARDNQEAMKAYVSKFHPAILGLTGTDEQVKQAADAYKVYTSDMADHPGMQNHSAFIYLMDANGKLVETFQTGATAEEMAGKIKDHLSTPSVPTAAPAAPATTESAPATTVVPQGADAPLSPVDAAPTPAPTPEALAPVTSTPEAAAPDAAAPAPDASGTSAPESSDTPPADGTTNTTP